MSIRVLLAFSLLLSAAAFGQVDPLANLSGTTAGVGPSPWIRSGSDSLTFFHGFDVHVTHLSQTGPEEQENATFSTNWFGAGAQLAFGERAFVLARGRVSLETYTIDESYPQFFQYVPEDGLIGRMRPHDLFGEVAVQAGYRPTAGTLVSVYGALVGQPALGAAPAQLRSSGVDFAEAPFTYALLEDVHDSTSVVTAGFATKFFTVEASMFHDGATTGDHTELDTGDIDSRSARLTITPAPNMAIQVSRGELGVEGDLPLALQSEITSASITYAGPMASLTALWTSRSFPNDNVRETATGYAIELALRASRNTFMARVEQIDRPGGFPLAPRPGQDVLGATHYTAGYIFDFVPSARYKLGIGVNIDYRTQTRELEDVYGHKPQGIYSFVRLRS